MSVRDLIDAIESGDSLATQQCFETEMMHRISDQMDAMRKSVAQGMFKESVDEEFCLEDFTLEELEDFMQSEEFNQLDEISGATLGSYIQKARAQDNAKREHGIELDKNPQVVKHKEKIKGWYDDKKYDKAGRSVHQDKIDKAREKIVDIKQKADPDYPKSTIPKRHKGIEKALDKLKYGKMTEDFTLEELEDFMQTEQYEQLDELEKKTLGSYIKKASSSLHKHGVELGHKQATSDEVDRFTNRHMPDKFGNQDKLKDMLKASSADQTKSMLIARKRAKGITTAVGKLTKEEFEDLTLEELEAYMQTEDYNQLDELSKNTLGSYIRKAAQSRVKLGDREYKLEKTSDDISKASGASSDISPETRSQLYKARKDIDDQRYKVQKKSDNRQLGIIRAVKRLTK